MREAIPKNIEGFKNMEPDDLTLRELTENEKEVIERFVKKYNVKCTIPAVFAFIVGTAFPLVALIAMEEMNKEIIEFAICFAGLFYIVGIFMLRNRLKEISKLKGLQVGLANGVWSYRGSTNSSRSYYMDVVFSEEKRRMKNVICLKNDYEKVNQGDKVLVFAYDKRKAYGCIIKE